MYIHICKTSACLFCMTKLQVFDDFTSQYFLISITNAVHSQLETCGKNGEIVLFAFLINCFHIPAVSIPGVKNNGFFRTDAGKKWFADNEIPYPKM